MSNAQGYHAGGHDWLAIWRQMQQAERTQAEAFSPPQDEHPHDHWQSRAARFAAAHRRQPQPDAFMRVLLPHLQPGDTVLDVGAGTGRYVPVLAQHAAQVIAIEPSPAMRHHLEQHIAEEGLQNVQVLGEAWPLEHPIQGDVVISAHVLYSTSEIAPFLQAMHAAARRLCMLSLMIRHLNSLFSPFWERIHGQPRLPMPAALEAYNALFQLGYPATLELIPARRFTYTSFDEALEDVRQRLRLAPDPQRDAHLTTLINDLLICDEAGNLTHPHQPQHSAVIWWKP